MYEKDPASSLDYVHLQCGKAPGSENPVRKKPGGRENEGVLWKVLENPDYSGKRQKL
jgi:hypothetical protein